MFVKLVGPGISMESNKNNGSSAFKAINNYNVIELCVLFYNLLAYFQTIAKNIVQSQAYRYNIILNKHGDCFDKTSKSSNVIKVETGVIINEVHALLFKTINPLDITVESAMQSVGMTDCDNIIPTHERYSVPS